MRKLFRTRPGRVLVALVISQVVSQVGSVRAEDRMDLQHVPDVSIFEALWPLDRGSAYEGKPKVAALVGLGGGRTGSVEHGVAVVGASFGYETRKVLVATHSELTAADLDVVRGRHRALVVGQVRDGGAGAVLSAAGELDHGQALGISPAQLGAGRRIDAAARGEALVLFKAKGDASPAAALEAEAGTTRWLDPGAGQDRADRRAMALAFAVAPTDGELPRGRIDIVRGRVEHATIHTLAPAFAAIDPRTSLTEVRKVEVGVGANEVTLHIDRELLAVIVADFGWTWLESDGPHGHLADSRFRMRLANTLKRRDRDRDLLTSFGAALAREPGYTPDGSRLVTEWRLELAAERTTTRFALGSRGVLAWLQPRDGAPGVDTLLRYGIHSDAFYRIGSGFEVGVYHAASFEPRVAIDPWASPRAWATEVGALARWRLDAAKPRSEDRRDYY